MHAAASLRFSASLCTVDSSTWARIWELLVFRTHIVSLIWWHLGSGGAIDDVASKKALRVAASPRFSLFLSCQHDAFSYSQLHCFAAAVVVVGVEIALHVGDERRMRDVFVGDDAVKIKVESLVEFSLISLIASLISLIASLISLIASLISLIAS